MLISKKLVNETRLKYTGPLHSPSRNLRANLTELARHLQTRNYTYLIFILQP